MKFSFKRVLALVLVLVLTLSLVPVAEPMHVHAAGTLSTISGLTASWSDASNSKGAASWSASGTSITGTSTGYKQIFNRTVTTTLTLTNNSGDEATLSFSYALTNDGSVSGAISGTSGEYSGTLANGASITITLKSPSGATTNTLSITGLALISTSAGNVTATFNPAAVGGSYTVDGTAISSATEMTAAAGTKYELVATAASGYQFFGWFDEAGNALDYNATYSFTPAANVTVTPKFISSNAALFGVGAAKFDDLTEAGAFAAAGSNKTVVLLNNGTVSGNHTIPAGVTLLVPFDASNTLYTTEPAHTNNNLLDTATWVQPTAYRTLTLAADANITVNGSISVSAKHFAGGGDPNAGGCGVPTGNVGFVQMTAGSQITLNNGANLYAWGYIIGGGSITAKSGAKIYENFMIRDFRGGGCTTTVADDGIVFPLNQYYVQNVEVPTNYEYGSEEHVYTSLYISGNSYSASVKFIGDGAMFQPQSGCVLTKDYIENKDRLELTVNGNFALANMALSLAGTEIDSSTFILPITNNITINIDSGIASLKQDIALLPGVELNIAYGATLDLTSGTGSGTISDGTGYNIFVYDLDEWSSGYSLDTFDADNMENNTLSTGLYFVHQAYRYIPLKYAPGRTYNRTASDLKDAVIDVNGTIITNGFMYTTAGGASIISSGKTGVVALNSGAGAELFTYQAAQIDTAPAYYVIPCNTAALQNGDGTYLSTVGAEAGATYNYCATCDKWVKQITVTFNANGGADTMDSQILELPCCEKLNSNTFTKDKYTFGAWNTVAGGTGVAYADGAVTNATSDLTLYAQWNEIKTTYTVTWVINGEDVPQDFEIGVAPVYNGEEPTKASDGCTTYTFAGWVDQAGNTYAVNETLPEGENRYTPVFTTGTSHTNIVTDAAVAPGCESSGLTEGSHCEACGTVIVAQTTVSATGHKMQQTSAQVDATCEEDGKTAIYTCANGCGKTEGGDVIPATGHSHVDGKCACGDIILVTLPGSFNDWSGYEMTWNEGGYYTYSMHLDAGTYTFKIKEGDNWLGNNGTIGDTTSGYEWIFDGNGGDCTLNASGGTYTFTYNINTKGLKVDAVLDHVHSYSTTYTWGSYYATCEAAHSCDCGSYYTEECMITSNTEGDYVFFTANSSQGYETASVKHVGENYAIYFDNTATNWANVNAYVWNNDSHEELVNWPGSAMTDMGNGLYKIIIPAGYDMIIFNNGSSQTADISMPDSYANIAVYNGIYNTCSWGYNTPESVNVIYVVDDEVADSWGGFYYGSKFDAEYQDEYVYKPSQEGYTFSGYDYTNAPEYLTGDVTFYGTMTANTYTVTLIVDGVQYGEVLNFTYGQPISLPDPIKAQNGCTTYTFAGWNENVPATMPAQNLTITGSFTEGKSHTAGNVVVEDEVAADCTNDGSYCNVVYCSVCGEELSHDTVIVPATGHTAGNVVVEDEVAAECTNDGSYCNVVYCADCGEELSHDTVIVPATGHTAGNVVVEDEVAADCTNDGSYCNVVYCSVCGEELSHDTVIVPATGHSETDLSYNPYGDGTHDVICNVCGDISEEKATCSYVNHQCEYCEDLERMTVIFMDGNEVWRSASCGYGEPLNFYGMPIPDAPEGHAWAGWYTEDGVKVEPGMTLTTNLVAYATWTKQSYTLTVDVWGTDVKVDLTVPYGAKLIDVLNKAVEDGKLPGFNAKIRKEDQYENGYSTTNNYYRVTSNPGIWIYSDSDMTMPANNLEIYQTTDFVGWSYYFNYSYDEDWNVTETYAGATYDGEDGSWLVGWNYIEEDFDGVEGGAWYYFAEGTGDWSGFYFRAEGLTRVPYPTEAINGITYAPDQETLDYAQANGIEFIDAESSLFVFDENGKFQSTANGLTEDNRWAVNGMLAWHPGLVEVDGEYFYFTGDEVNGGNVMATGDVYMIRNTTNFNAVIGGIYTFDADGKLCVYNGITEMDNCTLRYYINGQLMIGNGLTQVGENYIYVRSNGELVVNAEYYVPANDMGIAEGIYTFDGNGYIVIPEADSVKDGIYFENGAWYYYENGTVGYNKGLIFTDKNWYDADGNAVWGEGGIIYVRSNGKLATGTYYVTNLSNYNQIVGVEAGTPLQFTDMGLMMGLKNGIIDGYYYVNNQIAYSAGLVEIDGNYYYVRSNGQIVVGREYWISNANDTGIKLGCYTFDENGVMQLPETYGFTGIKDGYYYVDGAVAYGAGLVMLDDGTYIYVRSNGQLAVGKYWPTSLNGYLPAGEYDFGEDGILTIE